jgi:hypothetical protein
MKTLKNQTGELVIAIILVASGLTVIGCTLFDLMK